MVNSSERFNEFGYKIVENGKISLKECLKIILIIEILTVRFQVQRLNDRMFVKCKA